MAYWFWVFVFYSFLGWGLERGFAAGRGAAHQPRRCMAFLPLCPVYGLGVAAVLALPGPMRAGLWLPVAGAVVTTAVEYGYHWVCEALFGVKFWDYSKLPGNLHGRVALPFSLAWGALIAAALWLIQPGMEVLIARIPAPATYLALLVFTADLVCSVRVLSVTRSAEALRAQA